MKRILIYLITVLFITSASAQEFSPGMLYTPDYKPGDTLKIMAFNTENLTDLKDNLYINNRMEDSQDKSKEEKAALLSKVIKAANADIVMISEFETIAYLRELSQKYDWGYKYFASSESQTWYQNTMIMSKVPIGTFRTYGSVYSPIVGEKDQQGNPAMQININSRMWIGEVWPTADQRLYLCGVHLKAGRNKSDTATRIGQTELLKGEFERIVKADKKACILMAGDFNSTPESYEFKMLLQGSKRARLIDPLAGTTVYSHPAGNPRWRIDHMVYNKNLASKIVPGSTGPAYILSKQEMTDMSDHLPVVTKILLH